MRADGVDRPESQQIGHAISCVWRKKHVVLLALCACIGPVIFFNETYPPVYQATTSILLEPMGGDMNSLGLSVNPLNKTFIVNQIEEIKSLTLAEIVVAKLDSLTVYELMAAAPEAERRAGGNSWLVKTVKKSIDADPVRDSDIIRVSVSANSPSTVATLANTLVEVLEERNLSIKREEVTSIKSFIEDQMDAVRERLKTSEDELNGFKEKNKVNTLDKESEALLDRMTNVEMNYNDASTERGALEEELQAIRDEMDHQRTQLGLSVSDFSSPWIQKLKQNLVDLQVRFTTLQVRGYDDSHPEMKLLAKEIEATRDNMAQEIQKFAENEKLMDPLSRMQDLLGQALTLEIQIQSLKAKEDALDQIRDEYNRKLESLPGKELVLARLSRAKQVNEKVYMMLLEKYEEARISEAGKIGNIRIIDPARVPDKPIKPRKALNLALATLIGLSTGVLLAFHLGSKDRIVRTLADAGLVNATPLLGVIPDMKHDKKRNGGYYGRHNGNGDDPMIKTDVLRVHCRRSVSGEAYRVLRTNLRHANGGEPIKTIVVSSPGPSEGKTTTVVNLALTMAEAGMRTIIVESDLRKPRIHDVFGVKAEPGLTSFLVGQCGMKEVVRATEHKSLWIVPVGKMVSDPSELLSSPIMSHFLNTLKTEYDVVILDTPPILLVTDAAILATQVDGVVVVMRSGVTTSDDYRAARQLFQNVNAPYIGSVLNQMTPERLHGKNRYYSYYGYHGAAENKTREMKKPVETY